MWTALLGLTGLSSIALRLAILGALTVTVIGGITYTVHTLREQGRQQLEQKLKDQTDEQNRGAAGGGTKVDQCYGSGGTWNNASGLCER